MSGPTRWSGTMIILLLGDGSVSHLRARWVGLERSGLCIEVWTQRGQRDHDLKMASTAARRRRRWRQWTDDMTMGDQVGVRMCVRPSVVEAA